MTQNFSNLDENLTGKLLIATPHMADTFFSQSVIYLCSYSPTQGAMGLIINKRVIKPTLSDVFKQLSIQPNPPKRPVSLCLGGPVDHDRGFVLHTPEFEYEGCVSVTPNVKLTANLNILKDLADGKGPTHAVMALGHAAWSPGQLETEILKDTSWFVAPADQDILFSTQHSTKWRKALASINIDPILLSNTAGEA